MACLWVLGPRVGGANCGPTMTAIGDPGLQQLDGDAYLLFGAVPPDTSYIEVRVSDTVVWQRPVSNIIALAIEATSQDTVAYTLFDKDGNLISTESLSEWIARAEGATALGEARTRWADLGLGLLDPEVWRGRLERMCSTTGWDSDLALRLAEEFIAEDIAALSADNDTVEPTALEGASALDEIVELACPEILP